MHKENKCIKKIIQIIQQNYTLKPENPVYQYCTTVIAPDDLCCAWKLFVRPYTSASKLTVKRYVVTKVRREQWTTKVRYI